MGKYNFEQKTYILKTLTPVHVGYGDVVDVFNFVVDPQGYILVLDMDKFYASLSSEHRDKLISICNEGDLYSIIKLYKFMDSHLSKVKSNPSLVVNKIKVCKGFISHYNKVKSLPKNKLNEINRFQIFKLATNPNLKQPIIPGSSIKGSIRTAILNYYKHRAKRKYYERKDFLKLEKDILGYNKIPEDIMKFLKVSDFLPKNKVNTQIMYAVNRKKDGNRASGPYQIFEIIEAGAEFQGTISIMNTGENLKPAIELSISIIEQAIKNFYEKIYNNEDKIYKSINTKPILPYSQFPIKIGRHSSAEAVTIEDFRKIKVKVGKKNFEIKDHSTTIWFCSETQKPNNNNMLMPMGWLELIPSSLKQNLDKTKSRKKQNKNNKDFLDFSALQSKFKVKKYNK